MIHEPLTTHARAMGEALLNRMDPRAPLSELGRQMRGLSLLEMCREFLIQRGENPRGMDRMQLAGAALSYRSAGILGTSDFSSVLASVANKRLRMAYDENPGTYRQWAYRAPAAPDFKAINITQMSAMPDLLRVNEAGEIRYGALRDSGESYGLLSFGRIVSLTRQAVVNDDLRAFDTMARGYGASAARLENRMVYAQLTSNPTMADGLPLFHSARGNLQTGGGSALQLTSLATMRAAMRKQVGLQGEELNIVPRFLLVPAALEQTAYQCTSANYVPAAVSQINEFRAGGRTQLLPIVEPILDGLSSTAWYAATDMSFGAVEYCYLDGAEGPIIDSEIGFDLDGLKLRCRLDFAAKAADPRGLQKADGA